MALKLPDLDLARGAAMIREGKGGRDRVVPLGERGQAWIEKYLADVRPELVVEPDDGTVFLNNLGEPFSPNGLTQDSLYCAHTATGGIVPTLFRTPSIHVHQIERVEIHGEYHPFLDKVVMTYLDDWRRRLESQSGPEPHLQLPAAQRAAKEEESTRAMQILETAGKAVSLLAGIAVIVFVVMAMAGQSAVAGVSIGTCSPSSASP